MELTSIKLPFPLLTSHPGPLKPLLLLLSWMHVWLSMNRQQRMRRKRRGSQIFRKMTWWRGGQVFSINKALPQWRTTVSCLCPPPSAAHKGRSPRTLLRGANGKCWQTGARNWTPGGLRFVWNCLTAWGGTNNLGVVYILLEILLLDV